MAEEDIKNTANEEENQAPVETPEAATDAPADDKKAAPKKRKVKRNVAQGQVHVQATFNNTIVTVTDPKGNVLTSSSAGANGFRGSKKGTAYAAQVAAERAIQAAKQQYGLSRAEVFIKGIGLGRDAATRVLATQDIAVEGIADVTGVPHGGVRPPKARRV